MATSVASDKLVAAMAAGDVFDPFVTSPSGTTHARHSNFDTQLFAMSPGTTAEQVKRALEAHIRDTERRMEEAGRLGNTLLHQRKVLADRLQEVKELESETDLNLELRHRLAEIEKDYNEVARDSARAFLPKQRLPSNETAQGSPFAPEGNGGRRSVSPSKFESLATGSPTKLSVPNRKLRNQPANRIHDIEFAADISSHLIAQVRTLQAALLKREEELKVVKVERSRLEIESEGIQQRIKTLDESESRYKDENWNLETQIHELMATQREAADREKKLIQTLNILQAEKNTTQRELEEVKDNFSKQDEKHTAAIKNLEIELGTSRRNAAISESERSTMHKKVEELMNQNQELAKAFSIQRGRALERESGVGTSDEDLQSGNDKITPEHSPPPSPIKGTPRHSMLESETLKTSLGHAQRTIQTLRTNIHREKTEKLELRRMLQDAREELEKARADPNPSSARRSRKVDSREFKKPLRLGALGGARTSKTSVELLMDDGDWEEHVEAPSPRSLSAFATPNLRPTSGVAKIAPIAESHSDHFDTANETSDAAFETARERATETEDFQTGVEELSDDDSATETEASPSKGAGRMKRPSSLPLNQSINRYSFESSASTSSSEDDHHIFGDMKTPTAPAQKMRLRVSRGVLNRRSGGPSEEPTIQSSPINSASNTPRKGGQSLFAELGDFEGSDDDSLVGGTTPSRRSTRSFTPTSLNQRRSSPPPAVPALPKVIMVDSGMMTEPVDIGPPLAAFEVPEMVESASNTDDFDESFSSQQSAIFMTRPISLKSVIRHEKSDASTQWLGDEPRDEEFSRPLSSISYSDASAQHDDDIEAKLAQFPSPPTSPPRLGLVPTPILPPPQSLSMSHIQSEDIQPQAEVEVVPAPLPLTLASIVSEDIEPQAEIEVPPTPLPLTMSSIVSEAIEPLVEVEVPPTPLPLTMSSIVSEDIEPLVEVEIPPTPPPLSMSSIVTEHIEPVLEPEVPLPEPPTLSVASLVFEHVVPQAEPEAPLPALSMSSLLSQHIEPVADPIIEPEIPVPTSLSLSAVQAEHVEPVEAPVDHSLLADRQLMLERDAPVPATFSFSSIKSEHVVPQNEPAPPPVQLSFSSINVAEVEPRQEAEKPPLPLSLSSIHTQDVEPLEIPDVPLPALTVSSIHTQDVEPLEIPETPLPPLTISAIHTQDVEPRETPETPLPLLTISSIHAQDVEPRETPEIPPPALTVSSIHTQDVEPLEIPEVPRPPLTISSIHTQDVEPLEIPEVPLPPLTISSIYVQDVEPREIPESPLPPLTFSSIHSEHVEPREVPDSPPPALSLSSIHVLDFEPRATPAPPLPPLSLSAIESQVIEPVLSEEPVVILQPISTHATQSPGSEIDGSRSPKRNAFIIPRDADGDVDAKKAGQQTPPEIVRGWDWMANSGANDGAATQKRILPTADQEAQTTLTSAAIDQILKAKNQQLGVAALERSNSGDSVGTPSTVRVHRREGSVESPVRSKGKLLEFGSDVPEAIPYRRPGSSASGRGSLQQLPPLPPNHKEVIEAARSGSSNGGQALGTSMAPPPFSATALRTINSPLRPRTPNGTSATMRPMSPESVTSGRGTPTPRGLGRVNSGTGYAEVHSPSRLTSRSRKSSVSSFTSELDTRFNIHPEGGIDTQGFGANTDPRMIQAITQTMIGEYLWKYTRKAGRGEMSGNRHRRYFWVHPYTRTLYWSDRDPSSAGRSELRAKSVQIEAVRVVNDDNPMPPGLHRKSLIIISPGRSVKFTCTTGQRHETWFNALSYLLLRSNNDGQSDAEEIAGNITKEDVDEFNPGLGRRPVVGSRAPPSLSSYNSRTVRTESPAIDMSMNIPTLAPSPRKLEAQLRPSLRPSGGTLGRISGYWKESKVSGTFGSLRSRSVSGRETSHSIYEASEAHDSAEDLRQMIERQDRESDRLENVRACCDGKHDVSHLTGGSSKRGRHPRGNTHVHAGPSSTPTPSGRSSAL
ncbi:hypothetical protein B0T22DRAFT_438521 [Podospora appendiculata]|uniref:PH domain-containing protein n=1 Tax=Podospora appendiculata TaxID=314037 RepID=A0AAE0XLU9_9PEZI|nr:hypothetical protein B0T22DRAFT_438521 [Podospora appendiculata]